MWTDATNQVVEDEQYLVLLNSSNTSSSTVCGGVLASTSKLLIAMISSEWVPIFEVYYGSQNFEAREGGGEEVW